MKYIVIIAVLMLSGCAGMAEKADKVTQALLKTAEINEHARCRFRTVEVLTLMIEARGAAWATGYALSCPNLKPIFNIAMPTIRVELPVAPE